MKASTKNAVQRLLFIMFIIIMMPLCVYGFPFIHISTPEGLSNRHVSSMAIDDNGYYWFATHSGIDKFNGVTFYHYTLTDGADDVLPNGILKDCGNSIVAFSEHKVYRYSPSSDSFQPIDKLQIPQKHHITVVKCDNRNRLWIGTSKGLFIYDNEIELIGHYFEKLAIYDMAFYNDSFSYTGTSKGLWRVSHPSDGKVSTQTSSQFDMIQAERVQSLYCDPQTKNLWVGTFNGKLYALNLASNETPVPLKQFHRPIRKIEPIDTDQIWVGVDGDGIFVYNRFSKEGVEEFIHNGDAIHRYSGANGVYDILQDNDLVWICTYSNGLFVYDRTMPVNGVFAENDLDPQRFGDSQVNCLYQDRKGRIWFGTNNGIKRYAPDNHSWAHFISPKTGNGTVLALKEDRNGNMWAGGFMFDVMYIDPSDNIHFPQLKDTSKEFPRNIYSIHEDRNGDLYFGGIINGMARYNIDNQSLSTFPIRGIYQIISLPDGNLLIATTNGVVKFNTSTLKVENFEATRTSPLLNGAITRLCINPTARDQLWIGTETKGLVCVNLKTGEQRQYTIADGLSNMTICGLEFDRNSRLWASTENGLNCIAQDGSVAQLTKNNGLPHQTMKARSHCMLESGEIIWGTPTGAFILNPDEFVRHKKNLNLHFERLMISGKEIGPGIEGSPLETELDKIDVLSLGSNQNNFSISFCNVGFQNESAFKYAFILEGFDKEWRSDSYLRLAHYTNVPPGKYTFRVKAIDSSDPTNTMERTLTVKIAQPWYNTGLAWLCYIIILIGALFIFIRLYKRWMSVRDSDQKVRFFVNLAHDLRTPLTLIKAPLQDINTDILGSDDKSALNLAKKNADKLLNMVNQLLDFQKIERDAMSLKVEETNIGGFLRELACNFTPLAQAKNVVLKAEGSDGIGFIDRKKITVIVDNLLSNAIKYTESGGNVSIEWKIDNGHLTVKVADDGIGIPANEQKKLFNRFYRADNASNSAETGSGIGLLLTRKMAILHKGSISVVSELGVGSTFIVTLPIMKNKYSANEILVHENSNENGSVTNEQSDNVSNSQLSLMLVEDNDELRLYLEHTLGKNYAVRAFANGDTALEKVKSIMPDFILSDVMMPGISGLELCSKIKSDIETSHIPVILLTSLAEREDIIKGFNAGADDYITKPFDIFILNKKIASIIKARKTLNSKIIESAADEKFETGSVISELDREFMQKVIIVITENMANDDFSINDLAADMAMSRSVFFKKIKAITQQNPQELIRTIKMKKASDLILEDKYSIAEISYMTGFPNPKYFSTAFKKFYGVSPTKYAEENKNK